jgi:hypothetical protein
MSPAEEDEDGVLTDENGKTYSYGANAMEYGVTDRYCMKHKPRTIRN